MRANGKTFRAIIAALARASIGKEVFLVTPHGRQEQRRIYEVAFRICEASLTSDFVSGNKNQLVLRFKNGGHVHFAAPFDKDRLCGKRDAELIEDD